MRTSAAKNDAVTVSQNGNYSSDSLKILSKRMGSYAEPYFLKDTHANKTTGLSSYRPLEPVEALEKRHVFVRLGSANTTPTQ